MANLTLGTLLLQLKADTGAFSKGLQSAQKMAFDSADSIVSSLEKIGDKLSRLKFDGLENSMKSLSLAGGVLAGVAAGVTAAVLEIAKSTAEQAKQIDILHQRYGVSVEDISALRVAAKLTGVDLDSLTAAMGKMVKSAATVAESVGGHTQAGAAFAFKALGVTADDLKKTLGSSGGTMELLGKLADGFQKLGPSAAATALSMQVFGKTGNAILPFLFEGSEGVRKFKDLSDQLGLTWTQKDIVAARQFAESVEILSLKSTAFKEHIARGVIPALDTLSSALLRTDTNGTSMAKSLGETVGKELIFLAKTAEALGTGLDIVYLKVLRFAQSNNKPRDIFNGFYPDRSAAGSSQPVSDIDKQIEQLTIHYGQFLNQVDAGYNAPPKHGGKNVLDNLFGTPEERMSHLQQLVMLSEGFKKVTDSLVPKGDDNNKLDLIYKQLDAINSFRDAHPEVVWVDLNHQVNQLNAELEKYAQGLRDVLGITARFSNPLAGAPSLGSFGGKPNYTGSILGLNSTNPQNVMSDDLKKRLQDLQVFLEAGKTSAQHLNDAIKALDATFGQDKGSPEYLRALQAIKNQLDENTIAGRQFGQEVERSIEDLIINGRSFSDVLKQLAKDIEAMALKALLLKPLENFFGRLFGNIGPFGVFNFGGGRAGGGPVAAGTAYLVNENTPNSELFVPDVPGQIINQNQIRGNTYYQDFRGAGAGVEHIVRRAIADAEPRIVGRAIVANREINQRS